MKTKSVILVVCFIIFNILLLSCGKDKENKTTKKESENSTQTQQQTTTKTPSNTSSSEVGKIWSQVETINTSMGKGINSGKTGHLEDPVAKIISLLNSVETTPGITPENLEAIKTKVSELKKTGSMMDKYQHANKSSELKTEYEKFSKTLSDIKGLLPAGSF